MTLFNPRTAFPLDLDLDWLSISWLVDIAVGLALKGYLLKGEELGLGSCILTAPLIFIQDKDIRKAVFAKGTSLQ